MTLHRARFAPHRWLMLAILALGLVVQPILGSVSELHELSHDVAGTHGSEEPDCSDDCCQGFHRRDPRLLPRACSPGRAARVRVQQREAVASGATGAGSCAVGRRHVR